VLVDQASEVTDEIGAGVTVADAAETSMLRDAVSELYTEFTGCADVQVVAGAVVAAAGE